MTKEYGKSLERLREPLKFAHHTYNRNPRSFILKHLDCAQAPCAARGSLDLFTLYLLSVQITGLCHHALLGGLEIEPRVSRIPDEHSLLQQ